MLYIMYRFVYFLYDSLCKYLVNDSLYTANCDCLVGFTM